MHRGETDVAAQTMGLLEIALRFAGEAGYDIRRDRGVGDGFPNASTALRNLLLSYRRLMRSSTASLPLCRGR